MSFALQIPRGQGADTVRLKAPSNKERVEWIGLLSRAKRDCADARRAAALGPWHDSDSEREQARERRASRASASHRRTSSTADQISGYLNRPASMMSTGSGRPGSVYSTHSTSHYDEAMFSMSPPAARQMAEPRPQRYSGTTTGSFAPPPLPPRRSPTPEMAPPLPPRNTQTQREGQEVYDVSGHKASMYDHEF